MQKETEKTLQSESLNQKEIRSSGSGEHVLLHIANRPSKMTLIHCRKLVYHQQLALLHTDSDYHTCIISVYHLTKMYTQWALTSNVRLGSLVDISQYPQCKGSLKLFCPVIPVHSLDIEHSPHSEYTNVIEIIKVSKKKERNISGIILCDNLSYSNILDNQRTFTPFIPIKMVRIIFLFMKVAFVFKQGQRQHKLVCAHVQIRIFTEIVLNTDFFLSSLLRDLVIHVCI